jgi:hypothetical protein
LQGQIFYIALTPLSGHTPAVTLKATLPLAS